MWRWRQIKQRWQDWRRGYTDADEASAVRKLQSMTEKPNAFIELGRGEFRAIQGRPLIRSDDQLFIGKKWR
jgi:hypothetical protein